MMAPKSRRFICVALLALLALAAPPLSATSHAQVYPDRTVRIVVPFPAGGSNDVIARLIAQKLSEALGEQFIIENRSGAGGNTGADSVAKSPPDGYTLLLSAPGPLVVNQTLYDRLGYDPAKDFAPIALVAVVQIVLMVNPSVPANNVGELIALAKKEPGTINFGSSGIGSTSHLAGELLKSMAGIDILHIPYRGAAPAMSDLIGGHIPMLFDNMPAVLPQVIGKQVRALAVAGSERASALPDVPTIAESGVPGFDASAWFGLVAPARTPAPILAKLSEEVGKALKNPGVIARFHDLGADPGTVAGPAFGAFLAAETTKWAAVVRASGAKAE
jgi:tripartite-type tricarboxylate transporter receptor subunit TctC